MIGKFFCTADFTMAYVFSSELNPTVVRTSGMGISLGSSRIGSIIATQVHLLVSKLLICLLHTNVWYQGFYGIVSGITSEVWC